MVNLPVVKSSFAFSHPGIDDILVRRLARRRFEEPSEVIGTHVDRLSNPGNSQMCVQLLLSIFDSAHQLIARQPIRLPARTKHCPAMFA